jgi:glyoxylase I family protein
MPGPVHHFGLTVRDAEASAAWYIEVLGFERVDGYEAPTRRKVFLRHPALPARLGLTEHRPGRPEPFDEHRIGLDHLAFAVPDREALDDWAARLAEAGVPHSPITPANTIPDAYVLVFRDPDNIQLELFYEP